MAKLMTGFRDSVGVFDLILQQINNWTGIIFIGYSDIGNWHNLELKKMV